MSFFYDLNKRLQQVLETPKSEHQQLNEGVKDGKIPTDWMGVPTQLPRGAKPIPKPAGYDEYIKQGAKYGFQDDPNHPLRKKFKGSQRDMNEGDQDVQPYWKYVSTTAPDGSYYYLQGSIDRSKKFPSAELAKQYLDDFFSAVRVTKVSLRYKVPGEPPVTIENFDLNELRAQNAARWEARRAAKNAARRAAYAARRDAQSDVAEGDHTQHALDLNPDLARQARKPGMADRVGGAVRRVASALGGSDDPKGQLLNRMGGVRTPLARDTVSEGVKEIPGGRRHTSEPGGYGRKDDEDAPKTKTQRGRGRPKKDADASGEVKKYDWSAFGATGKDVKLPKHKGEVTRHKMVGETTKEIPGGRRHTADAGGYGRRDDEDEKGKKVAAKTQRGRGRPKKGGDSETGEVKKYDWSAFGATGKDVKLPKHKGAVTKHKMVGEEVSDDDREVLERLMDEAFAEGKNALGNAIQGVLEMMSDDEQVNEKAVSKSQRAAAGIAYAAKKGDLPRSELKGASKEMAKMPAGELKKFAKTKEKGLPEKADAKKKTESASAGATGSGSVAATGGSKGKGGMSFGKGIYDSMNRELEGMIAESMNVSLNMNSDAHGGPSKSITVTATDDDADRLTELLQMAGMGHNDHGGCDDVEVVDENSPDWPTNPEYSDDALQYSGGLNKPKRDVAGDGQSTVPVTAVSSITAEDEDLRRMMEMAGIEEAKKAKPDFLDVDKDGDKEEPFKKAVKDKKEAKVDESIFAMTRNLWTAYKG